LRTDKVACDIGDVQKHEDGEELVLVEVVIPIDDPRGIPGVVPVPLRVDDPHDIAIPRHGAVEVKVDITVNITVDVTVDIDIAVAIHLSDAVRIDIQIGPATRNLIRVPLDAATAAIEPATSALGAIDKRGGCHDDETNSRPRNHPKTGSAHHGKRSISMVHPACFTGRACQAKGISSTCIDDR
jgi:hypothetical protein